MNQQLTKFAVILLSPFLLFISLVSYAKEPPKLILQITIDQMRGDFPTRYYDKLSDGGFKYFLNKGVVFTDAHHQHANTETIVGHTTLATGAHPSSHGMVGNLWYDSIESRAVYNIEDARYSLLSENAGVNKNSEIDPTQATAKTDGRSPSAILTTTFSDELNLHFNGQSKVFGVSVKDRGAVSMAGHTGKAFWFSKKNGQFVTSNYYYDQYPNWVVDWNKQKLADKYANTHWNLLKNKDSYLFKNDDDQPWETDLAGFKRTFPHPYGKLTSPYYYTLLTISPAGDDLTLDFAKHVLLSEKLGKDNIPDYLSVSFSSTDYVGHMFGPNSLESEDNILRLDKTLEDILKYVDKQVGLNNTLVVLSADHGAANTPGYLNKHGIPASYITPDNWPLISVAEKVKKQFGIKHKLIEAFVSPYLYLTDEVKQDKNIDHLALEKALALAFSKFEGVQSVVSSRAIQQGQVSDIELVSFVRNNLHTERSGELYFIYKPHHFINDFDSVVVASTHGSPWSYDTFVPIMFAGNGLSPKVINKRVNTVDIAKTLSNYVGINAPSGAVGKNILSAHQK